MVVAVQVQPEGRDRPAEEERVHRRPEHAVREQHDIWSCPGVGKLSFRFTTTSGNQLRALAFEVMQKQLKSVGIELVAQFGPTTLLFGQILPSGDWDLFMFTWSPEQPDEHAFEHLRAAAVARTT